MRLKGEYLTQEADNIQFLVPVGRKAFNGIIRSNPTAAFMIGLMHEDISEAEIVDAMCERYDAPRDVIASDVAEVLNTLRGIGVLEE